MDFALMSCPYCGGDIDTTDASRFLCRSCGKSIYTDRENIRHFIRPGELEDSFNGTLDALQDENPKKALSMADELLNVSGDADFDAYFLRGAVYASMGEDGKAAADWKKGMELLTVYSNIDAYICLMGKCIADMIYEKEKEYIEFAPLKYIDRLSDEIYASTSESCKSFFYYTIYRDYRSLMGRLQLEGEETFTDVVPKLFRRIVEYHRNYWCLIRIIDEYLISMGYNPETYVDDDMEDLHVYDLIKEDLKRYTADMTDEDRLRIFAHWDDKKLMVNEEHLETILSHGKDKGVLGKLLSRRSASESETLDEPDAVDQYVKGCLLLLDAPSDDAQVVE